MKIFSSARVLALILATFPGGAFAQFETATVLGTVKDGTGAVIAGSKVMLENVKTGVNATTRSNESGSFDFIAVQVGTYRLKAESAGFKTGLTAEFTVAVQARQRIDVTLEVGDVSQSVAVRDTAAILETESSDRGQVINNATVVNLPLNGRNYSDLALLAPGVRKSFLGMDPFGNAGRNTVRGYAIYQADLGLHKSFPLWSEGKRLEFRTEMFNVLNKTNFQAPNSTAGSSAFGTIRSAFPARVIQVAAKIVF